jgi:serine/threonine protein kinase
MPLTPGSRLGPYEILSPLGAGGMGEVYRARDPRLGRDVAIKIVPEALAGSAPATGRFEREARAVAALQHPNICAIYDIGETELHRQFISLQLRLQISGQDMPACALVMRFRTSLGASRSVT